MMATTFWHPDGTPMSAQQFREMLFGKLPDFFQSEEELRKLWSTPDTRAKLLAGLAEKGFGHDQLAEMQKIIDAENSDIFDVLAHVAYALPPVTRAVRADHARVHINSQFNAKQQTFLDFVLPEATKCRSSGGVFPSKLKPTGYSMSAGLKYATSSMRCRGIWSSRSFAKSPCGSMTPTPRPASMSCRIKLRSRVVLPDPLLPMA
jgi:hypothetical protein